MVTATAGKFNSTIPIYLIPRENKINNIFLLVSVFAPLADHVQSLVSAHRIELLKGMLLRISLRARESHAPRNM